MSKVLERAIDIVAAEEYDVVYWVEITAVAEDIGPVSILDSG